jgi:hypothetical protein
LGFATFDAEVHTGGHRPVQGNVEGDKLDLFLGAFHLERGSIQSPRPEMLAYRWRATDDRSQAPAQENRSQRGYRRSTTSAPTKD